MTHQPIEKQKAIDLVARIAEKLPQVASPKDMETILREVIGSHTHVDVGLRGAEICDYCGFDLFDEIHVRAASEARPTNTSK